MRHTFRVGELVRVVKTCNRHELRGKIVQVMALSFSAHNDLIYIDIPCLFDIGWAFGFPEQFSPLDDGHEKITWAECAWRPQAERNIKA